jgi:hypothetical protein
VLAETSNLRIHFRHSVSSEDSHSQARACVEHTVELLQRTLPESLWSVQIVCDAPLSWSPSPPVCLLTVPASFSPPNGARGAARRLHYAALHCGAGEKDWVVHLGAGAALRERTVDAILAHVVDEAHRQAEAAAGAPPVRLRLAQGQVCLARPPPSASWLPFLASTHGAGESLALTRCALECREAWSGVDGCLLLSPHALERSLGFDCGSLPAGGELSLYALRCRDRGAQFAWLDAPVDVPCASSLSEQVSRRTATIRARLAAAWGGGGEGMPGSLSLDRRAPLLLLTVSRGCAHLCLCVSLLSLGVVHQLIASELLLNFCISVCSGTVLFTYVLGLEASVSPTDFGGGPGGMAQFLALLLAQAAAAPLLSALEVVATVQALRTFRLESV